MVAPWTGTDEGWMLGRRKDVSSASWEWPGRCRRESWLSRLESFIRRLQAQQACLDLLVRQVEGRPGSVLELGLGNGRTYDHLRSRLPGRRIVVVEREPRPHGACLPPAGDLLVDTFEAILAEPKGRLPDDLVLVHADIGTGDAERNARLAALVARGLAAWLPEACLIASDQALPAPRFHTLPLPDGVEPGRYHVYRVGPMAAGRLEPACGERVETG